MAGMPSIAATHHRLNIATDQRESDALTPDD